MRLNLFEKAIYRIIKADGVVVARPFEIERTVIAFFKQAKLRRKVHGRPSEKYCVFSNKLGKKANKLQSPALLMQNLFAVCVERFYFGVALQRSIHIDDQFPDEGDGQIVATLFAGDNGRES